MARVAALVGDPARASMLAILMDGRAHTPTELALEAGISAATSSGHLAQLRDGGLVSVAAQGRHRYYRLASRDVAHMLEAIMALDCVSDNRRRATPRVPFDLREARTCYDHLAGRLGVVIADTLASREYVLLDQDAGQITDQGAAFLRGLGVDLAQGAKSKRLLCRACLDWSERKPHIAGVLGAAMLDRFLAERWIERTQRSRSIHITRRGQNAFRRHFGWSGEPRR